MSPPDEKETLQRFFGSLGHAPARVLLLDYDGTLAPFRVERDHATPYPGVRNAIQRLLSSERTRVVVISGRTLSDLRPLLGVEPPPELWGTHGWERLERGAPPHIRALPPAAQSGLERGLAGLDFPTARIEVKPASVAVHVRGLDAPEADRTLRAAEAAWEPIVAEGLLEAHPFDGGLELRVRGWDKGDAVRAVLAAEPAGTAAAYLGDDRTDEDAFRALDELAKAGRVKPLNVLVRGERRETRAAIWLRPPDELLDFLQGWDRAAR